jgi:2-polyprenyl-3-methyl-5-hydroxy-6-metoxy-1,4-benzoquinol methylase
VWADIAYAEYAARRHNVWDDGEVTAETADFYGRARERAHRQFLQLAAAPGRLLDVGCGLGYFLERAQKRGWHVRGCDTSPAWVAATNARVGAGTAATGTLPEAIGPDERFDLITAWDVIEHVHDPIAFLVELTSRLAPGGRIFLRTPNLAYVLPLYTLRRRLGHDVGLEPTNHVVYFSAATMRRALTLAGLRPVGWPSLAPPQVETFRPPGTAAGPAVALKNLYAGVAGRVASISRGRAVLASDLDVLAAAASG